jgi:hypothetical protein
MILETTCCHENFSTDSLKLPFYPYWFCNSDTAEVPIRGKEAGPELEGFQVVGRGVKDHP